MEFMFENEAQVLSMLAYSETVSAMKSEFGLVSQNEKCDQNNDS
jgi:hypothetical protein